MNGIEALIAMKEGKMVKDEYGIYYRMEGLRLLCYVGGEWSGFEMDLSDWMGRNFEFTSKPVKYDLTFFEAMCKANEGAIVSNDAYPEYKCIMKDGVLHYYENYNFTDSTVSIDFDEMKGKWRVVEEEEE